jgi:hypothetical protein
MHNTFPLRNTSPTAYPPLLIASISFWDGNTLGGVGDGHAMVIVHADEEEEEFTFDFVTAAVRGSKI